ncbi:hypothetical protein GCM10022234_25490 [Aeromicrobium panaciterrae]|uniref:hypothetical protein n=1 Tax=Aeromicrobium panaciterrae TaxID=363861 RepID=UPI0031D1E967
MTLDELLTATREVDTPDGATLVQARDAALAAVHQDLTSRARIARRRVRRRVVSVATLAAAAGVAFVVVPSGEKANDHVATPTPPVVEVKYENASQIVAAAAVGAGHGSDHLGDAPYWKVISEYAQTDANDPSQDSAGTRTIWQGIDGPSVLRDTFGGDSPGETLALPQTKLGVGGRSYTWRQVNAGALSGDQIRALLTEGEAGIPDKPGRAPHEWYFFKQAGELLSDTPASPAVRKALWKELATLTGVTTSGKVTDSAGREGWNLTFALKGHGSQRFIVDPASGAILQAEVENTGSTYRVTYLEAGPASSAPTPTPTLGKGTE